MKKLFYAGIFSVLISGCATPKTTLVSYPVVVDEREGTYIRDSNDNCTLKIPDLEGKTWYIYDDSCKGTADSISIASLDRNSLLYLRENLTSRTKKYLDTLLQSSVEQVYKKHTTRRQEDFPF